jgi:hypothetical protein
VWCGYQHAQPWTAQQVITEQMADQRWPNAGMGMLLLYPFGSLGQSDLLLLRPFFKKS